MPRQMYTNGQKNPSGAGVVVGLCPRCGRNANQAAGNLGWDLGRNKDYVLPAWW